MQTELEESGCKGSAQNNFTEGEGGEGADQSSC